MANVTVNGQGYTGVNEVLLPVTNGGGTEQRFILPPSGTKSITANGSGIDVADYAEVNVNVPTGITPTGTRNITANGTYDVTQYASANVNVSGSAPVTQEKTVTPSAAGSVVTPDSGKLLSKVTVNGDADLIPGNIKSGVNIFGVSGTYGGADGTITLKYWSGTNGG